MSWLDQAVTKMRTMAMGGGEYGGGGYSGDVYGDGDGSPEPKPAPKPGRIEPSGRTLKPLRERRDAEPPRAERERERPERERGDNVITMPGMDGLGEIIVFKPERIEDCDDICWHVRNGCAVALNLQDIDRALGQRIVDFVGGVIAALDGDAVECARRVYLVTPRNFTITGQHEEVLRKAGIMPSFK